MPELSPEELDAKIRLRAFKYLDEQRLMFGGELPFDGLREGFRIDGVRVPLVGPQGIFKPKAIPIAVPLSITTAPIRPGKPRPYEDEVGPDNLLRYRYRGKDPDHHENAGLRLAMQLRIPLIYFEGIDTGWYSATYPVYVIHDDPRNLRVTVAADQEVSFGSPVDHVAEPMTVGRRAYATQLARRRIHQDKFRHFVLKAYREACAVCALRRRELLEAAHIIPDREERGVPEVFNGMALCKLHHGAFDSHIVGVRPDNLVVEVREDVRRQADGPMLVHGLQRCHGQPLIIVPSRAELQPRKDLLEEPYERFRRAG